MSRARITSNFTRASAEFWKIGAYCRLSCKRNPWGLAQTVRDWMPARWGEWHLADVWLELPEPVAADSSNTGNTAAPVFPATAGRCPRSKAMSFRTKLFLVFLVTVLASVSLVAYGVTHYTQAAFEESDAQRSEALVAQFNKEYAQRGDEIVRQVKNITDAQITLNVAIDLAGARPDFSLYVHDAAGAAQDHGLDFVEFVNWDGTLISSAQYPARVGYKNDWVIVQ